MTSDRHLALMNLMSEVEAPSRTYRNCVRRAASTETDSPQNLAAIERGSAALDDIEAAVRRWVAAHPAQVAEPLPEGFERHACVTVKCAVCGYHYDETEYDHHFPSVGDALDGAVGSGWDELKDGRVLCEDRDEKHEQMRQAVGIASTTD